MSLRLPNPASLLKNMASQCAVCHSWPARRICAPCLARFGQPLPALARCCSCALILPAGRFQALGSHPAQCAACLRHPPPLDACFAAVAYAYPWSDLIADYKFANDPAWATVFASLLLQMPGVTETLTALQANDWLIPMPLSTERLQSRGFNQAWELVKALASQSGTLAGSDAQLLLRIKNTAPQSQLPREARLQNVSGAFVASPLRVLELKNRRVLLVDDVMTSGASLFGAAQALRDAGAVQVSAIVFARTE